MNELERSNKYQQEIQAIRFFITWLEENHNILLMQDVTRPDHYYRTYERIFNSDRFVYEYFGIDPDKHEQELRQLLDDFRSKQNE
jgi:hypothetical protein